MKKNDFVKPNEQGDACISFAIARKSRMKTNKLLIRVSCYLLISSGSLCACSGDHEEYILQEPDKPLFSPKADQTERIAIGAVSDKGTIRYSEEFQQWYISSPVPNTIDGAMNYFPLELTEDFKEDGMKVTFSGMVYEFCNDIHEVQCYGNRGFFYISLTNIEKVY